MNHCEVVMLLLKLLDESISSRCRVRKPGGGGGVCNNKQHPVLFKIDARTVIQKPIRRGLGADSCSAVQGRTEA